MRTSRAALLAVSIALAGGAVPDAAAAAAMVSTTAPSARQTWVWPLQPVPPVVRPFEPPAHPWEAGHRGVDLLGSVAQPVLAIGAGIVGFAGPLAGRGVVVIDHGTLRSTYEPVTATVHRGDHVAPGQVVGLLQMPHSHCVPEVCLHLGIRRGSEYLDPLDILGPRPVRLKPLTSSDAPLPHSADPAAIGPTARTSFDAPGARSVAAAATARDNNGSRRARLAAAAVTIAMVSLLAGFVGDRQARG